MTWPWYDPTSTWPDLTVTWQFQESSTGDLIPAPAQIPGITPHTGANSLMVKLQQWFELRIEVKCLVNRCDTSEGSAPPSQSLMIPSLIEVFGTLLYNSRNCYFQSFLPDLSSFRSVSRDERHLGFASPEVSCQTNLHHYYQHLIITIKISNHDENHHQRFKRTQIGLPCPLHRAPSPR